MQFNSVLVTGAGGFIGFHLTQKLCKLGYSVTGLDNLNNYYDVNLKLSRLAILKQLPSFKFVQLDLADDAGMKQLFETQSFDYVVNLAAQGGGSYSLTNPHAYLERNLHRFLNILER